MHRNAGIQFRLNRFSVSKPKRYHAVFNLVDISLKYISYGHFLNRRYHLFDPLRSGRNFRAVCNISVILV